MKDEFFKSSSIPCTINEFNNSDLNIRNSLNHGISKFPCCVSWPSANSVYNCHNSKEIKLLNLEFPFLFICALTNLNIDFKIHLIPCGLYEEPTSHLPLHCVWFATERSAFLSTVRGIERNFLSYTNSVSTHSLLSG